MTYNLNIRPFPIDTDVLFSLALYRANRKNEPKTAKILAATDLVFYEKTTKSDFTTPVENGLTAVLDTTTYPDRAVLKSLTNNLGYDVYLRSLWIKGKRIMQYSGKYGELLHDGLKRDDDIRRNGEKKIKISNSMIVDGTTQMPKIADWNFKKCLSKKHMYTIVFAGFVWHYSLGEWYNLQLGAPDTNEYIDSVVECYSVETERPAGTIGQTRVTFREVVENWTKTTLYTTRAVMGSSPRRKANVANRVIVAASSFSGEFDYSCDGTDDDVQIQEAIDYMANTYGGGEIHLSGGVFYGGLIYLRSNILLTGEHDTIYMSDANTNTTLIYAYQITNSFVRDIVIDGNPDLIYSTGVIYLFRGDSTTAVRAENVTARNVIISANTASSVSASGFHQINGLSRCSAYNISCANTGSSQAFARGFSLCNDLWACKGYSIGASRVSAGIAIARAFESCSNMTSCTAGTITASGGTTTRAVGFGSCVNILSSISDNSSANSIGYESCKSVQQCRSLNNASHYGTGATQSYADSGTANACADTYQGGFNS